jgi:hypothetical protein
MAQASSVPLDDSPPAVGLSNSLGDASVGDLMRLLQNNSGFFDGTGQNRGTSHFAGDLFVPGARANDLWLYPSYPSILGELSRHTLNPHTSRTGPLAGDATWAFQWDADVPVEITLTNTPAHQEYISLVPEPSTIALLALALAIIALARRHLISSR